MFAIHLKFAAMPNALIAPMGDELICEFILAGLEFWLLYWFIIINNTDRKLEQMRQKAVAEGRKVSFWITPRGQKIAAWILIISFLIWNACLFFSYFYLGEELEYGLFQLLLGSLGLFTLLAIVIVILNKLLCTIGRLLGFKKTKK